MMFRELTKNRDLKLGTYIGEFATPGIGPILKNTGCDFVFVDMEHSGFTFETVKAILRNLHDAGLATLLRPPSHAKHHISLACDVGAQGVCPPMMGNAGQSQAVIDAINYPPAGTRGAAFAIAHDDYTQRSVADAIAFANNKTSFVALIETAEGVDNVEAIAALEGCDCLWIGHFDLSNSLGIPGAFDDLKFTDATERVMAAAAAHNKSVGRLVPNVQEAERCIAQGCDFICYSGDIWLYREALDRGLKAIRAATNN
ncbi:MAG: hpch/hpai aldolase [Gammaproteobacteria bacterium]|nr:hpch/hpai aldolase [Gammaproteobacteria bacterium]